MGYFECCRVCPSTKRRPGCHSICKEYIEQKAKWDAIREKAHTKRVEEAQLLSSKRCLRKH